MHEDYDDNEYDDDQYDYDHPSLNPYNYYFKFDVSADSPLSKWLTDMFTNIDWNQIPSVPLLNNIPGFPVFSVPVNSWNPNAGKDNSFQYLGSNYTGSPIWKKKYFVIDKVNNEYKLHLQANAKHFVSQPTYYQGLFDILN
jgi:hypothetical protein